MGKKVEAYQADDGKFFTGSTASLDMERYECMKKAEKRIEATKKFAQETFNIPLKRNDGERFTEEEDLMNYVCSGEDIYFFDSLIECITRLRLYDTDAFDKFVDYLKK